MTDDSQSSSALRRLTHARVLRRAARAMFDDISSTLLETRNSQWVHQDSFDAGLVAAAHYMLDCADRIESGR